MFTKHHRSPRPYALFWPRGKVISYNLGGGLSQSVVTRAHVQSPRKQLGFWVSGKCVTHNMYFVQCCYYLFSLWIYPFAKFKTYHVRLIESDTVSKKCFPNGTFSRILDILKTIPLPFAILALMFFIFFPSDEIKSPRYFSSVFLFHFLFSNITIYNSFITMVIILRLLDTDWLTFYWPKIISARSWQSLPINGTILYPRRARIKKYYKYFF